MPYNGYSNRATWNIVLWVSNDEGMYNSCRKRWMAHTPSASDALDWCIIHFGHNTPDGDRIADADFDQVAKAFAEL